MWSVRIWLDGEIWQVVKKEMRNWHSVQSESLTDQIRNKSVYDESCFHVLFLSRTEGNTMVSLKMWSCFRRLEGKCLTCSGWAHSLSSNWKTASGNRRQNILEPLLCPVEPWPSQASEETPDSSPLQVLLTTHTLRLDIKHTHQMMGLWYLPHLLNEYHPHLPWDSL